MRSNGQFINDIMRDTSAVHIVIFVAEKASLYGEAFLIGASRHPR